MSSAKEIVHEILNLAFQAEQAFGYRFCLIRGLMSPGAKEAAEELAAKTCSVLKDCLKISVLPEPCPVRRLELGLPFDRIPGNRLLVIDLLTPPTRDGYPFFLIPLEGNPERPPMSAPYDVEVDKAYEGIYR